MCTDFVAPTVAVVLRGLRFRGVVLGIIVHEFHVVPESRLSEASSLFCPPFPHRELHMNFLNGGCVYLGIRPHVE